MSLLLLFKGSALAETLVDNFDDNSRDLTLWNQFNSPLEQNGHLEIVLAAAATLYKGYTSIAMYDFTGSYNFAELVNAGNQSLASLEVYPAHVYDSGNVNGIYWLVSGNSIIAGKRVASANTTILSTTYNSTTHRWFRIRESGGTTFWDYSANGISWTNFTSAANPFTPITSLFAEPSAGTYASEASGTTIVIDNFNVTPTASTVNSNFFQFF